MKFSDFDSITWEENRQYYDTCLIPFTGLTGSEGPAETVLALEKLRDFMDMVEKPFRGRIVTYPVLQYRGEHFIDLINELCRNVKSLNFRYAIVLTAELEITRDELNESDLVLSLPNFRDLGTKDVQALTSEKIQELWMEGVPL
ncbi:MAG: YpiF family protein [Paenibacillus sp.]|nr:YpiF family protein [Paenibacillus sp.]